MALFGQGVAEMFKDVVPQSSQGYGDNTIDWANVKPFQVIKPMSSWAATNTGATAPAAPTQATAPQSEYQKWLAQQSGMKSSDGSRNENTTSNLTDQQWAAVKDMRNAYGWNNPVDVNGAKAFGAGLLSMAGVTGMSGVAYNAAQAHQRSLNDFLSLKEVGQNAPVGYNGDSYALGAGLGSMPAEAPANLTPEQQQAMTNSLTAAGYYNDTSGYNPAGDLSPTGYAADGMGPPSSAAGGRDSGRSKIVCTAMNQAYGFGSYRNAIWLKYSADSLTKAHEVGYHAIFQPLVSYAYNGSSVAKTIVKKTLENIARHRTSDIRAEMRNGKRDIIGRCYRFVLEPLCYVVGKLKGY